MGRLPDWLNAVASKQNYLSRLQVAIERLHGVRCELARIRAGA
jgi:hypothetical protein